jgi:hypothetical protein
VHTGVDHEQGGDKRLLQQAAIGGQRVPVKPEFPT